MLINLIGSLNIDIWIEDENGKLLFGNSNEDANPSFAVMIEDETAGWVKGNEKGKIIASLLNQLLQKEAEKKKLGTEVLNLYQEVNLIFNFSEKLAQAIEPGAIAGIALHEAGLLIKSNNGVVVLWDEKIKRMQVMASSGELFFSEEKINNNLGLLLKIILNGQSEIIGDISSLADAGIILPQVKTVLFAALKVNHRVMGAIIMARNELMQYTAADLKLLTNLALQSSAAIESALLYEKNIREVREREEAILRIHEVMKKFVPNEFIRSLGKETLTDVKLGDQVEKIVTVLFTDIRDFTSLSEKMTPEENFKFVSSFNAQLGPIIRANNGFINQYLGDSIMALFPGDPEDALKAAVAMQIAVYELNHHRQSKGLPVIKAGIGMHTGPLIMGITGDEFRMDAATISDTVNTAARIESLTKYYRSPLLLSGETLRQITHPQKYHLRHLGKVQLKGKYNLLSIVECINGNAAEDQQKKIKTLSYFNEAMNYYLDQRFENAVQLFQHIITTDPEDHTANFFMENALKYLSNGVPENWTGAEEMLNK